jgi:hypothetical protein
MMAFDRPSPSQNLEPDTLAALRKVLAESAQRGNHTDELQGVLKTVATEARGKGMPPERLLIVLKDVWHALPDVSAGAGVDAMLLQDLITRCIRQYYAD